DLRLTYLPNQSSRGRRGHSRTCSRLSRTGTSTRWTTAKLSRSTSYGKRKSASSWRKRGLVSHGAARRQPW
ncbi:uncharacterized protein TRAVEDRAFT_60338, partial [Trametes versicolor FP-101664 SS1]|uniref:uncharacterized protein n=1 Tax=Trametes versicolor (strain FP-101664) TaxID=717944 RepID=UPI0004621FD1